MSKYFDNNATTPMDARVLDGMLPYMQSQYGNASSIHSHGRLAKRALEVAREQVAALVNVHPEQVIFTSGGTEANNLAIKGLAGVLGSGKLAISAVEHASVQQAAQSVAKNGWEVVTLAVNSQGQLNADIRDAYLGASVPDRQIVKQPDPQPNIVSIMWANNETGVIQDITAIGARIRQTSALLHTDACQAAGKVAVDFPASGAHLMSLSAHKLYGPKGVGALIIDRGLPLEPLLHGGGHERAYRSGTENIPAIVGFGIAAQLAMTEQLSRTAQLLDLRDHLETKLNSMPGVALVAQNAPRLPNTLMVALPGIEGETLVMNLDQQGFAVSSGSACDSRKNEPSHVLSAMGMDQELAQSVIRVSLGVDNSLADVDALCVALGDQLEMLGRHSLRMRA